MLLEKEMSLDAHDLDSMPVVVENASEAAERIRAETWGDGLPVDPARIASILGIQVLEARLSDDLAGAIMKKTGEDPRIVINASDSPVRKRFTCAHELGHYVQRSDAPDELEYFDFRDSFSSTGMNPDERYANAFAAALLVPAEDVKRLTSDGLDTIEMSLRFGVSREAMQYRLRNLGLE